MHVRKVFVNVCLQVTCSAPPKPRNIALEHVNSQHVGIKKSFSTVIKFTMTELKSKQHLYKSTNEEHECKIVIADASVGQIGPCVIHTNVSSCLLG